MNVLAECGLERSMMPPFWFEAAMGRIGTGFDFGCEAFLFLQALVSLGFGGEPTVRRIFAMLADKRLPDGGRRRLAVSGCREG